MKSANTRAQNRAASVISSGCSGHPPSGWDQCDLTAHAARFYTGHAARFCPKGSRAQPDQIRIAANNAEGAWQQATDLKLLVSQCQEFEVVHPSNATDMTPAPRGR